MIIKKLTFCLFGLILLISIQAVASPTKKEIKKLNNALIFDLFMNFEISEKNGNLTAIIDYFPNSLGRECKSISINSNIGDSDETITFNFNNDLVENLTYNTNRILYTYDFIYEKRQLSFIKINEKAKFSFTYDKKGRLTTIKRSNNNASLEYNFDYKLEEKKVNINVVLIQKETRKPISRKHFVTWNDSYKIASYEFDAYRGYNLNYSDKEDLLSFSFTNAVEGNNNVTWNYTFDDKGNWVERRFEETTFKRTIYYK